MYILKNNHYVMLSTLLEERFGVSDFFSGVISYELDAVECEFISTLILYRQMDEIDNLPLDRVVDIVPVWWEFNTTINDEVVVNNFDFALLKEHIC